MPEKCVAVAIYVGHILELLTTIIYGLCIESSRLFSSFDTQMC